MNITDQQFVRSLNPDTIVWEPSVSIPKTRVLQGSPETSTNIVDSGEKYQLGLWRSTPGAFITDHAGYVEYFHVIEGTGQLIDEDGNVTNLSSGVSVFMPAGWKGRWVVLSSIIKSYSIVNL